jgi:hypothetical protein
MAKNAVWQDEYWLMLMQIYLRRPVGMKPLYSRELVELSLELHIAPQELQARMEQIARLDTPRLRRFWERYHENPRRLARAVRLLREMNGFGAADKFYEGVEVQETFERDFRPLEEDPRFTPVMLILILDLYFSLTPSTMVSETPEVVEMARCLHLSPIDIVDVLELYKVCDPYLNRTNLSFSPLLPACQQLWQRFDGDEGKQLRQMAADLRFYFE